MSGDNNCYIDRLWREAKVHGMTTEEFGGITEDKKQYFCNDCENWDCHVKRKPH